MGRLIHFSALDRLMGFYRGKVHHHLAKQKFIGTYKKGGARYLEISRAKVIACELIIHSKRKLEDVIEDLDNY